MCDENGIDKKQLWFCSGKFVGILEFYLDPPSMKTIALHEMRGKSKDTQPRPTWIIRHTMSDTAATVLVNDEDGDRIVCLEYDPSSSSPTLHERWSFPTSGGPTHMAFDPCQRFVLTSNYGAGNIQITDFMSPSNSTQTDGRTTSPSELCHQYLTVPANNEPGADPERQAGSHLHQVHVDTLSGLCIYSDLGLDTVGLLEPPPSTHNGGFDGDKPEEKSVTAAWTLGSSVRLPRGSGPRHGVFYPPRHLRPTHYIVACELSNEVHILSIEYPARDADVLSHSSNDSKGRKTCTLRHTGIMASALPQERRTRGGNPSPGGIALSDDGAWLYVTVRLVGSDTDVLSVLKLEPGCSDMMWVQCWCTGGRMPRMISVSQCGEYLFLGNESRGAGSHWQGKPASIVVCGMPDDQQLHQKLNVCLKDLTGKVLEGCSFVAELDL